MVELVVFFAFALIVSGLGSRKAQEPVQAVTWSMISSGLAMLAAAIAYQSSAYDSPREFRIVILSWLLCAGGPCRIYGFHERSVQAILVSFSSGMLVFTLKTGASASMLEETMVPVFAAGLATTAFCLLLACCSNKGVPKTKQSTEGHQA